MANGFEARNHTSTESAKYGKAEKSGYHRGRCLQMNSPRGRYKNMRERSRDAVVCHNTSPFEVNGMSLLQEPCDDDWERGEYALSDGSRRIGVADSGAGFATRVSELSSGRSSTASNRPGIGVLARYRSWLM